MGANILVGCGGTGVETLSRVNELLAEDAYWRPRLAADFYYVLADTEAAKLESFRTRLESQIGSSEKKPFVETINLSQGLDTLEQLVNRHFLKPFGKDGLGGNQKARERLFEHWWSLPSGEPFKAARVKPLCDGAGQCPSISYMLTWRYLKNVEAVFSKVIDAMMARGQSADPVKGSSFIIVGSLAGGTGRGSWQLMSFKLREMFARKGRAPRPLAYLSDVSIFNTVMERHPKESLAMRVNSATGMSELSAWMQNVMPQEEKRARLFDYRLPSMEKAEDPEADVLQLPEDFTTAFAPADAAFLTFRDNGVAFLRDNDDAHQMVGTAIYAGLTRKAVRGQEINDANKQYWSVAAATFEVPAMKLTRYFESQACQQVLTDLMTPDLDKAKDLADAFITANPWVLPTGVQEIEPHKDGDLLDRVWHHLNTRSPDHDWEELRAALEEDQDAETALEIAQAKKGESPALVARAIEAAVKDQDAGAALLKFARKLFAEAEQVTDEASGRTFTHRPVSLATIGAFLRETASRVEAALKELKAARYLIPEGGSLEDEIKASSGRDYLVFGKRFNDAEVNAIRSVYERAVFAGNFKLIKTRIEEKVKSWVAAMNGLANAAAGVSGVMNRVARQYASELNREFGTNGVDPFAGLFVDPKSPEDGIPDRFDSNRFYRRNVKPVLTREQMRAMLREGLSHVDYAAIDKLVTANVFDKPMAGNDSNRANDLTLLMRRAIDESVSLDRDFIQTHFSLQSIIGDLRDTWQKKLQASLGQRQKFTELSQRFSSFFGVEPSDNGDGVVQIGASPADMVAEMGASLASRCRPYWRIDNDTDSIASVTLFMPHWGGGELREKAAEIRDTIAGRISENVRVEVQVEENDLANPFVMLAYSAATADQIEQIRSLDHWKDDPEVKRMLEACEMPTGVSIFDRRTNGVGYIDPLFVRNPEIANMRWRPWYTGDAEARQQQALAIDALVYAMLEPGEELSAALAKLGWSLPLVKVDDGKIVFTRPAYKWEKGKRRDDPQSPWQAGDALEKSLSKTHALLDGRTDEDQPHPHAERGRAVRDAILAEAEAFWGEVGTKLGYGPGAEQRIALLQAQQASLSARKSKAKPANREVLSRMIDRLGAKQV